jgi:hypothetical protein
MSEPTKAPPNFNPSPKTRFQMHGQNLSLHKDMIASKTFEVGTDAAMLHLQMKVTQQITDGNTAMAAGYRMLGALEFLGALKTLAQTDVAPTPRVLDNLDHRA